VTGNIDRFSLVPRLLPITTMPRSRITIRDVAARAGVSHQTVSRVINNSERVTPETRQRVEDAIQELGYRPNAIARFMAQGRTRTFACFSPNLTDYTFASIIEGAETAARQQGYFLLTASAPDEQTFADLVEQLVASNRTEGLLVINPYDDGRHKRLPLNVPVVFLGAHPRAEKVASVSLDDHATGIAATNHLLELGHQRIALITGPLCEDCSQDRQNGYVAALASYNIQTDPALILEGDWSATSGYWAVKTLLENETDFTGIFAQNDRMAVGAIRALRETNLDVPRDISVIGVDDMPLASYFDPPLTTMKQDTFAIGQQAAHLLMQAVENPTVAPRNLNLPAALILRQSTAKVASNFSP